MQGAKGVERVTVSRIAIECRMEGLDRLVIAPELDQRVPLLVEQTRQFARVDGLGDLLLNEIDERLELAGLLVEALQRRVSHL